MNEHINLLAYDNYEKFTDFDSSKTYRDKKIFEIESLVDFIKSEFHDKKIKLLEFGSGNCKLPIGIFKKNFLSKAYAYEISASRNDFAKKWIFFEKIKNIYPINKNIIEVPYSSYKDLDLIIGVDLVFQFIEPIKNGAALDVLKKSYNWLRLGGKIILELNNLKVIKNKKTWEEFGESDPWAFSLWDCQYDEENNFLKWDKIFISKKDSKVNRTSIVLKDYEEIEIIRLLISAGFKKIRLYSDWKKNEYKKDCFEYILIAEK